MTVRNLLTSVLAAGATILLMSSAVLAAPPAHAKQAGPQTSSPPSAQRGDGREGAGQPADTENHNGNSGTVEVRSLGDAGTDTDSDPRLGCGGFDILGSGLADGSGTFEVLSWAPTGDGSVVLTGTWTYSAQQGGTQVIAGPYTLPAGHYRLDVAQDPSKHKMFWVDGCTSPAGTGPAVTTATAPSTPPPGGGLSGTTEGMVQTAPASSNLAGSAGANAAAGRAAAPDVESGGVLAEAASLPATAVNAATGAVLAATGSPVTLLVLGVLLLFAGAVLLVRRRQAL